jgi:betaine-aldehyde dehydrogenase
LFEYTLFPLLSARFVASATAWRKKLKRHALMLLYIQPDDRNKFKQADQGEIMLKYKMLIGGKWLEALSGKTYWAINPATGEEAAEIPLAGSEDIDRAVEAAQQAFPIWSKKSQAERSDLVWKMAGLLKKHEEEINRIEVLDHGTPIKLARIQRYISSMNLEYAAQASRTLMGRALPYSSNTMSSIQRQPIGVCALIIPWNSPLMMVTSKMGACLATGNTCIIKPSAIDSMVTLKLAEILSELDIPAGVINVVTGPGGTVGEALAAHPGVSFISFTGSSETGKRIMSVASGTLKRTQMELGGKNPFIVLEDAEIKKAAQRGVASSCNNTGMVCASPGRYYVHQRIYDEFIQEYLQGMKKIKVGDPWDEQTDMGPVVSAEHRERVEGYIRSGVEEGAKLLLGGKRPDQPPLDKGYFVMPAVFSEVRPHMKIYCEEIFGPVACFTRFSSDDEVIEMANDNIYGLCASVWTQDTARGMRLVDRINAGVVAINSDRFVSSETPWGGFKESGFGKENSVYGLEEYTQLKLLVIDNN